ncbi:hypothetical protein WA026_017660 [Henosepilachna vigintioctopunctata]|uniref:Chaperone DnaJ C-terminal domain-containing protein n=1 Tax=Henosepilachna vigintioctopunctata TaxID=420089 RepID=A0AAW1U9K0_9CUCU
MYCSTTACYTCLAVHYLCKTNIVNLEAIHCQFEFLRVSVLSPLISVLFVNDVREFIDVESVTLRADDLMMEWNVNHTITLTEALCGFNFVLCHLDGRDLLITHPAGSVLKPGDVKTVEGEGMPYYKNPFQKGNLNIVFTIKFPDNHFTNASGLSMLEKLLPPKPAFTMPVGDNVEEVDLHNYNPNERSSHSGHHGEAYASDDEEAHGPGIQCAQQ